MGHQEPLSTCPLQTSPVAAPVMHPKFRPEQSPGAYPTPPKLPFSALFAFPGMTSPTLTPQPFLLPPCHFVLQEVAQGSTSLRELSPHRHPENHFSDLENHEIYITLRLY